MAFSRIATTVSTGTGAREHAVLPAEPLQALAEHLQEAGVGVQHGDAHVRTGVWWPGSRASGRRRSVPSSRSSLFTGPAEAGVEKGWYTGFSHALSGEFAGRRRRPRRAISGGPSEGSCRNFVQCAAGHPRF